jgi:hypothetical protein
MTSSDDEEPFAAPSGSAKETLFDGSLCPRCSNHRQVKTPRSTFVMCRVLPDKYPRQPVRACAAFRAGQQP